MKVCVCGGTNPAANPKWHAVADDLGHLLVANKFEMVWGGNAFGLLSHVHQKYIDKKKISTVVLPEAYIADAVDEDKNNYDDITGDKIVRTDLVVERTHQMLLMANAVVIAPGGIGTVYEFWTAVEGKRAGEYNIDIILLNYNGFYDFQLKHFDFINQNGFTKIGEGGAPYKMQPEDLFHVATTAEECITLLQKIRKKRS